MPPPIALSESTADIFMWEKFMTKPFVDQGELRVLGYLDSPWHCFGLLARRSWLAAAGNRELLRAVVERALRNAAAFLHSREDSVNDINAHFDIPLADARQWIDRVRYAAPGCALQAPAPMLRMVIQVLVKAGLLADRSGGADSQAYGYSLQADVCDQACRLLEGTPPPPTPPRPAGAGSAISPRSSKRPWWDALMPSSASAHAGEAEAEAAGPGTGAGAGTGTAGSGAHVGSFAWDAYTTRLRGDTHKGSSSGQQQQQQQQ